MKIKEPNRTQGALGYITKSEKKETLEQAFDEMKNYIERPVKNLLLVEDDEIQRMNITNLIGNGDVHTTVVSNGQRGVG